MQLMVTITRQVHGYYYIHTHQLFRIQYTCVEVDAVNVYWCVRISVCIVASSRRIMSTSLFKPLETAQTHPIPHKSYEQQFSKFELQ